MRSSTKIINVKGKATKYVTYTFYPQTMPLYELDWLVWLKKRKHIHAARAYTAKRQAWSVVTTIPSKNEVKEYEKMVKKRIASDTYIDFEILWEQFGKDIEKLPDGVYPD